MVKREVSDESVDRGSLVHQLCAEFGTQWNIGKRPQIEKYLSSNSDSVRSLLLEELLRAERELKRKSRQPCSVDDYLARFPNDAAIVNRVIGNAMEDTLDSAAISEPDATIHHQQSKTAVNEVTIDAATSLGASQSAPDASPATRALKLFGDYELIDEIARGGMGVVYKARQVKLNRIVAIKMILSGQHTGSEEVERFQIEAEAAANLTHPGIVPIFEIGEHSGQHYFSMGFVEGRSLGDREYSNLTPPLRRQDADALSEELKRRVAAKPNDDRWQILQTQVRKILGATNTDL